MQLIEVGTRVKLVFPYHIHTGRLATVLESDPQRVSYLGDYIKVAWDDGSLLDTEWSYRDSFQIIDQLPISLTQPKIQVDALNGGVKI